MRVRNNLTLGLSRFSSSLKPRRSIGFYKGSTVAMSLCKRWKQPDVSARWADFDLTWRGERISGQHKDQLDQIESIDSARSSGKVGDFDLELVHHRAVKAESCPVCPTKDASGEEGESQTHGCEFLLARVRKWLAGYLLSVCVCVCGDRE